MQKLSGQHCWHADRVFVTLWLSLSSAILHLYQKTMCGLGRSGKVEKLKWTNFWKWEGTWYESDIKRDWLSLLIFFLGLHSQLNHFFLCRACFEHLALIQCCFFWIIFCICLFLYLPVEGFCVYAAKGFCIYVLGPEKNMCCRVFICVLEGYLFVCWKVRIFLLKGFLFVCWKVFYLCVERCPFQGRASGPCPPPVEMHRICNCTEYQAPIAARGQQG